MVGMCAAYPCCDRAAHYPGMTTMNPAAAAARETHRSSTGQFGTQPLSEADLDLTPGAGSAVQIDDALRALPIHVDDFQVFESDAPLYSDSKDVLLGAVAEHYAARGGATILCRCT